MRLFHVFALLAALVPSSFAQDSLPGRSKVAGVDGTGITRRDDLTPVTIDYTAKVTSDGLSLEITMDVRRLSRPITRIAMPNWAPGSYRIVRYGDRVKDLVVTNGRSRKTLDVTALDHQTWSIDTRGVEHLRAKYRLEPPKRRRFSGRRGRDRGKSTGFHIQGPGIFTYVVGDKERPAHVRYDLPPKWRVQNGLLPTSKKNVRYARDYDTLIDAPTTFGIFLERTFEVDGTPFICVFFTNDQKYDFDVDAFCTDIVKPIVVEQGRVFGSYPFPFYVFHFTLPGSGGLEHLNSTSIGLSNRGLSRSLRSGAGIVAHEFFHTWNVKRIRPISLGPFQYEHENYTGNLWVAEGWTSYYGGLSMLRAGMTTPDDFLRQIVGMLRGEMSKAGRKQHSVYWTSRAVWHKSASEKTPRVSYYTKGQILGMAIDLIIRHETDGKKSLDDVMRFLNRWFAERGVGFEEADIERACTAISNHDFSEFFARHVRGTVDPPFEKIFGYAGVSLEVQTSRTDVPFSFRRRGDEVIVRQPSDVATKAGLARGDVIITFGGKKDESFRDFLDRCKPGKKITLKVRADREDDTKTKEVKLEVIARDVYRPKVEFMENATKKQLAIRSGWMTGR